MLANRVIIFGRVGDSRVREEPTVNQINRSPGGNPNYVKIPTGYAFPYRSIINPKDTSVRIITPMITATSTADVDAVRHGAV